MKVPISVYPVDDGVLIYRNKQIDKTPLPFKPFILAQTSKFNTVFGPKEIWRKVPDDEEIEYTRLEFNTVKDFLDFKKRHVKDSNYFLSNSYLEQLYISNPDFFLAYPHTSDLVILFFDIEVASKGDGLFPKAHTNEILCIGYSVWIYDNEGKKRKVHHEICKGFNIETLCDKLVIDNFLYSVQKWNPDVVVGFNSEAFDLPYLIERGQINGCDLTKLCRGGREPNITSGDNKIRLPGRIHFDIYLSNAGVQKDQTLYNLKSKGLKEVARWYKIKRTTLINNIWTESPLDDIELKDHIENLLKLFKEDEQKLYQYLDDDIYRTEGVGHVYIRNCITLAEMMHTSLESIMSMYSSFVPKLLLARNMQQRRLINTETNFSKYNIQTGTVAKFSDELKFEGALVGLYQDGYFPAVYKLDFSAQYPSAIQTFNLGPDTTKLIRVEQYTGKYECIKDDKYNWYRIPTRFDDEKYAYDLIVRVKNNENGFLKQEITRLKSERKKIRSEIESSKDEDKITLKSQQNAIKVINNSLYGALGLKTTIYGDMISAIMVTSLCRWCTLKLMQRNYDMLIETDSVTGDTPIYVRNKNTKEINIIPIEDLHLSNEKRIIYTGNYEVLTRSGWKNIRYTKKHKTNKKVYRVKCYFGYIDCTEDHSLFNEFQKEVKPTELNNFDFLEIVELDFNFKDVKIKSINKKIKNLVNWYKKEPAIDSSFNNIYYWHEHNKVEEVKEILYNNYVYDISTEDGTFVTALGNIVLHNTDGIILNSKLDAKIETDWLDKEIKNKFFITNNYMNLEAEGSGDRAYFYLMKNYVLETEPGIYTIHGSSLKASRVSKVVDKAIKLGIDYIFNNKPIDEIIDEAFNFKDLSIEDFIERTKLSKEQIEYTDKLDWRLFLAKQVEKKTGQIITAGTQINYALTKQPLDISEFKQYYRNTKNYTYSNYITSVDELDFKYYEGLIDKALAKFGVSRYEYIKTDLFGPKFDKKPLDKKKPLDNVYMGDL